jgi:E3 ubiquitin-protein ligase mind-bomb
LWGISKAAAETKAAEEATSAAKCPYWLRCREAFLELARREGVLDGMKEYMLADEDRCFCPVCHVSRGDEDVYRRGVPPKDFVLPVGFARLALQIHDTPDVQKTAFAEWHTCYHGTKHGSILEILKQGKLLKPGDPTYTGRTIGVRPGHIEKARARENLHTKAQETFDPTNKIFFSPSIKYCDYGNVYMDNFVYMDKHYRFAFQVRLQSGQYDIGQQTVGAGDKLIDDKVPNSSIEWYTHKALHLLTGLLIKEVVPE